MGLTLLKLISPEGWAGIVVSLALGTLLAVQTVKTHHAQHEADTYHVQAVTAQSALAQTVANYRAAAERARADDARNLARVQQEQATITQQRDATYEARIADARARADRLRHQLEAEGRLSGPGTAPVRALPAAPGSPAQGPGEDGFSDALIATEQAIQLDELIKWVRQQHAVNVKGTSNSTGRVAHR